MAKLHEILAVETDLRGATNKLLQEGMKTFKDKLSIFDGLHRRYESLTDGDEGQPPQDKPLAETVPSKLKWVENQFSQFLDVTFQKEVTNTKAKADIKVGDNVLVSDVPVTQLLSWEKTLVGLRQLYETLPTLDLSEEWELDPKTGSYKTREKWVYSAKRVKRNHVVSPATDKHPAQVQVYEEDVPVGKWFTIKESGAVTTAEKAKLIGRVDQLLHAVKQARQRANECEVENRKVADSIFNFIHS